MADSGSGPRKPGPTFRFLPASQHCLCNGQNLVRPSVENKLICNKLFGIFNMFLLSMEAKEKRKTEDLTKFRLGSDASNWCWLDGVGCKRVSLPGPLHVTKAAADKGQCKSGCGEEEPAIRFPRGPTQT